MADNKDFFAPPSEEEIDLFGAPTETELARLEEPSDVGGTALAALKGYGEVPTFGFGEELGAVLAATAPRVGADKEKGYFEGWIDRYRSYRDALRKETEELVEKHPGAYYGGMGAGLAASALLMPAGAAAKGVGAGAKAAPGLVTKTAQAVAKPAKFLFGGSKRLGAAREFSKLAKGAKKVGDIAGVKHFGSLASQLRRAGTAEMLGKGVAGGALYGAGMSEADLTRGEVGGLAKDIAFTGALGGAASLLPAAASKVSGFVGRHPLVVGGATGATVGYLKGKDYGHRGMGALGGLTLGLFMGHGLSSPKLAHAASLAWRGVKDFSKESLYSAKSLLSQRLNDTARIIEEKFGIPAKNQIGELLQDALEKIGRSREMEENQLMGFIRENLTKWGKEIERLENVATKGEGRVAVRDMFDKARQVVEDNSAKLDPSEKQKLIGYLEQQFLKPAQQVERRIVEEGTEGLGLTEYKIKGAPKEAAEELLETKGGAVEFEPYRAKAAEVYERPVTEVVERGVVPGEAKATMSIQELKAMKNKLGDGFFGSAARQQADAVATEVGEIIRQDLGVQLGKDWNVAAQKYHHLKKILGNLGVDTLPQNPGATTDENVIALAENLKRLFSKANPREIDNMIKSFEQVSPGLFEKLHTRLPRLYEQEKLLAAARGKPYKAQLEALRKAGVAEASAERIAGIERTLEDVTTMRKGIGTRAAAQRTIRDIAQDLGPRQQARMQEMVELRELLKRYVPEAAQELETAGMDLSKIEGIVESTQVRPHMFHLSTYKHFIEALGVKVAGGLGGLAHDAAKVFKWLKAIPGEALARLPAIDRFVTFIKQNPGLESAAAKDSSVRNLLFSISQLPEDLPPAMAANQSSLITAAERGLDALLAKHYILEQQDPEYKKTWEEMDLE